MGANLIRKFQRPIKFGIVGGTGALIQLAVLKVLTDVFGIYYMFSAVLAILLALCWTYTANNYWTFKQGKLI